MVVVLNSFAYSFQILKRIFKGGFYKILLFFIFLLGSIIFAIYNVRYIVPIGISSIKYALGLTLDDFLPIVWFLYQVGITIYLSYLYFFYETNHSPEFIFLRTDYYHFAIKKYLIFLLFIFFCRVLLYAFVHLIFFINVPFSLEVFIWNIALHAIIATFMFIISIFYDYFNLLEFKSRK